MEDNAGGGTVWNMALNARIPSWEPVKGMNEWQCIYIRGW